MNLNCLKLSLVAAAATFVVGQGTVARAFVPILVANGTYVFEAGGAGSAGNDAFNGSTVTFMNNNLVAWDLVDALASPALDFPLTSSNSAINGGETAVIAANEW